MAGGERANGRHHDGTMWRWGVSARGRVGVSAKEPGNGRAKNSARPRLGSLATPIRAGFEPRRGLVIPPTKIERPKTLRTVRDGGATTTAQNRRGTAQTTTAPSGRRVFRPTGRGFSHTHSPHRRFAHSPHRLPPHLNNATDP